MTISEQSVAPGAVPSPAVSAPSPGRHGGYEVVCVCGGFGYPHGSGSPARITVVGKALQTAGIAFRLLHAGPSPIAENTAPAGVHEGIPFEYTTSLRRPSSLLGRALVYARALAGVTARVVRLRAARHRTAVWLYIIEGPANLYVSTVCRLLGLPVIQELCEWWPGEGNHCTRFTRWMHRWPMFVNPAGVLVISRLIGERVRWRAAAVNPGVLIHRLPAVVDTERFAAPGVESLTPWFVWCGAHPWMKDVKFILRAMAVAQRCGTRCRLKVVGGWDDAARQQVRAYAAESGIAAEDLVFTGYLDDRALEHCYRTAAALLLPLPDDDRSRTRMPNKLGEYLASGRPVITSPVGDMAAYLTAGVDACLAPSGTEEEFAAHMTAVLRDPQTASRIGAAGRECSRRHLDYRAHAAPLAAWFIECIHRGRAR